MKKEFIICLVAILQMTATFGKDEESKTKYPYWVAYVGEENKVNTGLISKQKLPYYLGVNCIYVGGQGFSPCSVTEYSVMILSDQCIIYTSNISSPYFSDEMKEKFKKAKKGDKVIFYDIHVKYPAGEQMAPSLVYTVE